MMFNSSALYLSSIAIFSCIGTTVVPASYEEETSSVSSTSVSAKTYPLPLHLDSFKPLIGTQITSLPENGLSQHYLSQANIAYSQSAYKKAMHSWIRAGQLGGSLAQEDLRSFSTSLVLSGASQQSIDLWQWIFKTYQEDIEPDWYESYIQAAMSGRKYALAGRLLSKAFALNPCQTPFMYLMGTEVFSQLQNHQLAIEYYEEMLNFLNHSDIPISLHFNIAAFYYQNGNRKMASKCMDLYFKYASLEDCDVQAYEKAAMYAALAGEVEKSLFYWDRYFTFPFQKGAESCFIGAAKTHVMAGFYQKGLEYFLRYFELTEKKDILLPSYFQIANCYFLLSDIPNACLWYDKLFMARNQNHSGLRDIEERDFSNAICAYLANKEEEKAGVVFDVMIKSLPGLLGNNQRTNEKASLKNKKSGKRKANYKKKPLKKPIDRDAHLKIIQEEVKKNLRKKCEECIVLLEKISFSDVLEMNDIETKRASLLKRFHSYVEGDYTVIELQHKVQVAEVEFKKISRDHKIADQKRQKQRVAAYLRTLGQNPDDLIVLSHEGEAQPVLPQGEQQKKARDRPVNICEKATLLPPLNKTSSLHVTFSLLKSAQKDYALVQSQPGVKGKYQTFLSELRADPLHLKPASGRLEKLQGDSHLFSRRFDKGNRFVYRVQQQDDTHFNIVILSLHGHYKHLDQQLDTSK